MNPIKCSLCSKIEEAVTDKESASSFICDDCKDRITIEDDDGEID